MSSNLPDIETEIAIIGGGLAGLRLASLLDGVGQDFRLLEARDRLGGRILSRDGLDLGPAWFWPGQPLMESLVKDLGLSWFEQFSEGKLVFQDQQGSVRRDLDFATMGGARRVTGGLGKIVGQLAGQIPEDRVALGSRVSEILRLADGISIRTDSGREIQARHAVLAIPPRLAEARISFAPDLERSQRSAMRAIPTWMAGHAKILAVYDRPFWRDQGFSGDGISHRGPLMEIHDASLEAGGQAALFGFVGTPPLVRASKAVHLPQAAIEQLTLMFGPDATSPKEVILADWAQEAHTATEDDFGALAGHPKYGLPPALRNLWDGRLILSSTETAPGYGGFLEGALEAADHTFHALSFRADRLPDRRDG